MTTVDCKNHVMFCRNAICVCQRTNLYCKAEGNVCDMKTLEESKDVCVLQDQTSESLLIKHNSLQFMRYIISARLEAP